MLQEHPPDRGYAKGQRHLLVAQQFIDTLAVERRAGHHQPGTAHGAGVGHSPGVDVEHRNHQQKGFGDADGQAVDRAGGPRMQYRRAMRVENAFRVAGGSGGIAQRRGGVFVELWPVVGIGRSAEQILVAEQAGNVAHRPVRPVGHDDKTADARDRLRQFFDDRHETEVEEQESVFGMPDDVFDLFREQTRVDGVQNRSHPRHAIIQLHMPVAIPRQGGDPLARNNP